jgi:hypothetical protein
MRIAKKERRDPSVTDQERIAQLEDSTDELRAAVLLAGREISEDREVRARSAPKS